MTHVALEGRRLDEHRRWERDGTGGDGLGQDV